MVESAQVTLTKETPVPVRTQLFCAPPVDLVRSEVFAKVCSRGVCDDGE